LRARFQTFLLGDLPLFEISADYRPAMIANDVLSGTPSALSLPTAIDFETSSSFISSPHPAPSLHPPTFHRKKAGIVAQRENKSPRELRFRKKQTPTSVFPFFSSSFFGSLTLLLSLSSTYVRLLRARLYPSWCTKITHKTALCLLAEDRHSLLLLHHRHGLIMLHQDTSRGVITPRRFAHSSRMVKPRLASVVVRFFSSPRALQLEYSTWLE